MTIEEAIALLKTHNKWRRRYPDDSVLILVEKENGKFTRYTANMKNAQVVYLCEMVKHELLEKVINEQ